MLRETASQPRKMRCHVVTPDARVSRAVSVSNQHSVHHLLGAITLSTLSLACIWCVFMRHAMIAF